MQNYEGTGVRAVEVLHHLTVTPSPPAPKSEVEIGEWALKWSPPHHVFQSQEVSKLARPFSTVHPKKQHHTMALKAWVTARSAQKNRHFTTSLSVFRMIKEYHSISTLPTSHYEYNEWFFKVEIGEWALKWSPPHVEIGEWALKWSSPHVEIGEWALKWSPTNVFQSQVGSKLEVGLSLLHCLSQETTPHHGFKGMGDGKIGSSNRHFIPRLLRIGEWALKWSPPHVGSKLARPFSTVHPKVE
eukprot:scaffold21459_cov34-Cyclotella_meneghiniana.AAC.1